MRKWKMEKKLEVKDDGRLMYYYEFELEEEANEQ